MQSWQSTRRTHPIDKWEEEPPDLPSMHAEDQAKGRMLSLVALYLLVLAIIGVAGALVYSCGVVG